jgi:hypothetical protein
MLFSKDIVTFTFTVEEQEVVKHMAEQCWLGSDDATIATHGTKQHDTSQYLIDQETGQYGELALHQFFFGKTDGMNRYILQREERNSDKYKGDQGSDLWYPEAPAIRVDGKATTMRKSQNPISYNLVVRPRDWHENTIYVLLMRPKTEPIMKVVGWALTNELPDTLKSSGIFEGAYVKRAGSLNAMRELIT